jgi:hypothetical protein
MLLMSIAVTVNVPNIIPLTIITILEIEIIKTEAKANIVKTDPIAQAMIAVMNVLAPALVHAITDLTTVSTKTVVLMIVAATDLLPTELMIAEEATLLLIRLLPYAVQTTFLSAMPQPTNHLKNKDILTKEDVTDPNRMTSTNQMMSTDYPPMPALPRS